ncbi:xanthine phosphoribosyltransferase [Candidatus Cetobacterium colombiensis]|uniref:Xanthine phosphoribosyltransferase n=1 Tax=Candidatus Cetobacterium colombiensis TaxID=3073100 RepID=A0ABU4W7M4_9FUSO|nr:xanthine phosphoribosyltransferase [Candidatus Cetobacterium colombiensis]MDX8335535.1 xanthine phosphoribosyltransferase [Candidatus Cetobacterium colombiensis]
MKLLKEYIEKYGSVTDSSILKVDSFINHQIDPVLMIEIGEELKKRFEGKNINKILTIEASGIAIGIAAAYAFKVPMVFAKKKKPSTMGDSFNANVHSFTKKTDYNITVSKEFLSPEDNILVVDDFLAMGNAIIGLKNIIEQAGANLQGVGIVIEKGFQPGGTILKEQGIHLESLAVIESLENNEITLR